MFGEAAVRLAGHCAAVLGWSPDRFWAATPAELAAVVAVLVPTGSAPVTTADLQRMEGA